MKFKATDFVRLRASVSDAAGNAVRSNVGKVCGITEVSSLRLGKVIDMDFECESKEKAVKELYQLSDMMLANTVIEDWTYELEELK